MAGQTANAFQVADAAPEHGDPSVEPLVSDDLTTSSEHAGDAHGAKPGLPQLDTTTFATLGSNAYNAVQFMASLVNESNFTSMYQQGENFSTLMVNVDENSLLVLVFPTHLTVGSMKYYASPAVKSLHERIQFATARGAQPLDLSDMDATDVQALFRKKDE